MIQMFHIWQLFLSYAMLPLDDNIIALIFRDKNDLSKILRLCQK